MRARKLRITIAGTAVALMAAWAPAAQAHVKVCNEAESSPRGDNSVAVGDKNPPARYTTDRLAVANGQQTAGVVRAAERSPALAVCSQPTPPPPPPPPPGGGGDDLPT